MKTHKDQSKNNNKFTKDEDFSSEEEWNSATLKKHLQEISISTEIRSTITLT